MERRQEQDTPLSTASQPTGTPRKPDNINNDQETLQQRKARLTGQLQQLQLKQDGKRCVQQQEQILQELLQLIQEELSQCTDGDDQHQHHTSSPDHHQSNRTLTQTVTPTHPRKRRKCQSKYNSAHLVHDRIMSPLPDLIAGKAKLVRDQPSRHDFDQPVRYLGGDETQFQRIGSAIIKAIEESQEEGRSETARWRKVLCHAFQETNPDTGYGFCFLSKKWMEQPDTSFGKHVLPSGFGLKRCETPGQPFYNPKRHVGHTHVDATTAILSLTNGKKEVKIARPVDCSKLTPDTQHGKGFYKDKPFDDDYENEVWETVVLLPGMGLLIPAGWPHCIMSEPNTLGISIKVRDLSK